MSTADANSISSSTLKNVFILGHSPLGLPIAGYNFGSVGPQVLILGGVHGDEIEGVWAAQFLLSHFLQKFDYNLRLTLIPAFNIDGVISRTRSNSRGVDLNRNLPTKDWTAEVANPRYNPGPSANSEPENQALVKWLEHNKPKFILSLHSWKPMLNINGDCLDEATVISKATGYVIEQDIGYPTPGCLGSFAGLERPFPTLTYEIERGLAAEPILEKHVPAILAALHRSEDRK